MDPLRILMASAEVAPLAKTGGLADVAAALSAALARRGHDVRLVMPLYRRVREAGVPLTPVPGLERVEVTLGRHALSVSVLSTPLPGADLDVWCLDCPALYDREAIYTDDRDEHLRWGLFARATLALCQQSAWAPDVVHANDWHLGLLPLYLEMLSSWDRLLSGATSLMTIHNIGYQGLFPAEVLEDLGLEGDGSLLDADDLRAGRVNFLRTGLQHAQAITTVSETYAREITGEEQGRGLEGLLTSRADRLVGILNGVDDEWDPASDALIPRHYDAAHLDHKRQNTLALLASQRLAPPGKAPVYGIVSRLAWQKGFDLLGGAGQGGTLDPTSGPLPSLLAHHDARLVVLGSGEPKYAAFFSGLARRFPGRVAHVDGYSNELAHLIEAGADAFLMPSRYEPCGLNQMYSLRYGTVPIVRRTGGLADTVQLYDPSTGQGNGIVFEHFDATGMAWALKTSLDLFATPEHWRRCQLNGMAGEFGWDGRAATYETLYARLLGERTTT